MHLHGALVQLLHIARTWTSKTQEAIPPQPEEGGEEAATAEPPSFWLDPDGSPDALAQALAVTRHWSETSLKSFKSMRSRCRVQHLYTPK